MSKIKVKKITAANWQEGTDAVYEVVGYEGLLLPKSNGIGA